MSSDVISWDREPQTCRVFYGLPQICHFNPASVRAGQEWIPRDGFKEIRYVVTYPKSGTTWCQMIIHLLMNGGKPSPSLAALGDLTLDQTFLEVDGTSLLDELPLPVDPTTPVVIKTHFPDGFIPKAPRDTNNNLETSIKYLCVVRNPKDALVSYFHHGLRRGIYESIPIPEGADEDRVKFDYCVEKFLAGTVGFGDWWDHVTSWWLYAGRQRVTNTVLHITYEEMKRDPQATVKLIAQWLGAKYAHQLEAEPEMMANILKYSSFDYMTQLPDTEPHARDGPPSPEKYKDIKQVRKGVVGGWKSFLTNDQDQRIMARFQLYAQRFGIDAIWCDLDCI